MQSTHIESILILMLMLIKGIFFLAHFGSSSSFSLFILIAAKNYMYHINLQRNENNNRRIKATERE